MRTSIGEWARAEIENIGRIEGTVDRLLDDRGFVVKINANDEERAKLFDKITWTEKHKDLEVSDKRKQPRFVPNDPHSKIVFADGSTMACFVIDLSVTGAGVSAQIIPPVGTVLALGQDHRPRGASFRRSLCGPIHTDADSRNRRIARDLEMTASPPPGVEPL